MAKVLQNLPDAFYPDSGAELPEGIIGSTIVNFGTVPAAWHAAGGGLVIDFIPDGGETVRRVVFGFNERGMWVLFPDTSRPESTPGDLGE
jgi:hypothetical protein